MKPDQIPTGSKSPAPSAPSEAKTQERSGEEPDRPSWIVLAHILRPQGRKGEVLAELLTDFPEQFDDGKRTFLAPEEFAGPESDARSFQVDSYWLPVGKNQGRIVLHFKGIDSINEAEKLSTLDVLIPESERPELDDDAIYVSDLIGCTVTDIAIAGAPVTVGIVTGVEFTTTPDGTRRLEEAPPLLTVESSTGDEILIPFAKAFLVSFDTAAKRITMSLPAGLLEINQ